MQPPKKMIGLDTNLLLRHVVRDDREAAIAADGVFDSLGSDRKGYINLIVLMEFAWVLRRSYRYNRTEIAETIAMLMASVEIVVEREDLVHTALEMFRETNLDLSDLVINLVNEAAGCETTLTFDQGQDLLPTATVINR